MTVEELWTESYNGEFYGEAIFQLMADLHTDPVRKEQLAVLAQLERKTRELLAPVVTRRGLDPDDVTESASEAATAVAGKSWEDFLDWLERVADHYLANYYRPLVAQSTDAAERRIAEALVQHEEALATYGRRVSGRETGDPLEAVYACPQMAGAVSV